MLATRKMPESSWELVLNDALHSVRSLLCTSTGCTPHERFFCFNRKSMHGKSIPDWLLTNKSVLLRKFIRSKSDPPCEFVDLLDVIPRYALVRHKDGRESTVSTSDLAPHPQQPSSLSEETTIPEHQKTSLEKTSFKPATEQVANPYN